MGYAATALVRTGWTGTIAVVSGGGTTTITPRTRESVASLIARLVHGCYVDQALTLTVSVSSTGVITLAGSASFAMVVSGTVATLTGFTGTYLVGASYTAASAYTNAWVPTLGLRLDGTMLGTGEGRITSSGGLQAVSALMEGQQTTLRAWTSHADAWTAEDDSGVLDVWHDGRIFGRVRLDSWTRRPMGRQRNTTVPYLLEASVTGVDPDEVLPAIPASWPTANAWLYSWVRTDHPGYRQIRIAGTTITLTSGSYRFDDLVAELSAGTGVSASVSSGGRVLVSSGDPAQWAWPDRLGWLLGFGVEAGTTEAEVLEERESRFVPPGGIPLLGVTWTEVRVERESELALDRSRRQGGYVFGGARVWRCELRMTRWALEALQTGWCLRGKITLVGSESAAMSSTVPGGALTGVALRLDGAPSWDDSTQQTCRVTLLVAGTTT
jgi:hypothetical protein